MGLAGWLASWLADSWHGQCWLRIYDWWPPKVIMDAHTHAHSAQCINSEQLNPMVPNYVRRTVPRNCVPHVLRDWTKWEENCFDQYQLPIANDTTATTPATLTDRTVRTLQPTNQPNRGPITLSNRQQNLVIEQQRSQNV